MKNKKKKTKKEENKKRKTCYSGKRVHQVYIYYGLMGLKTHTLCVTSVSLCPNKPPVPTKEYDIEKNSDTIGITTSSIFPFQ